MFIVGLIFLVIGMILVYGTSYIMTLFRRKDENLFLKIKFVGFTCAVIGALLILKGERPKSLEFLRIIERMRGV